MLNHEDQILNLNTVTCFISITLPGLICWKRIPWQNHQKEWGSGWQRVSKTLDDRFSKIKWDAHHRIIKREPRWDVHNTVLRMSQDTWRDGPKVEHASVPPSKSHSSSDLANCELRRASLDEFRWQLMFWSGNEGTFRCKVQDSRG